MAGPTESAARAATTSMICRVPAKMIASGSNVAWAAARTTTSWRTMRDAGHFLAPDTASGYCSDEPVQLFRLAGDNATPVRERSHGAVFMVLGQGEKACPSMRDPVAATGRQGAVDAPRPGAEWQKRHRDGAIRFRRPRGAKVQEIACLDLAKLDTAEHLDEAGCGPGRAGSKPETDKNSVFRPFPLYFARQSVIL